MAAEIWKPTTATDRVRGWRRQWCVQGFVGDCTPEASRSVCLDGLWSSAPCACACVSLRRPGSHMLPSAKVTVPDFDQGRIQCSGLARPLAAVQSRSHRIRIFLRQAIRRVRVQYVLLPPANRPICETQASRLAWQGTSTATMAEQPACGREVAGWPHTHSGSLGGRKDVGKWPGSRRSWRVGTVRQDGGEIWEPQTGFFCLSTHRPLQPLRHDCMADTSHWNIRVSGQQSCSRAASPQQMRAR